MPDLNDDERRVLTYVRSWYREHRGALSVQQVADALGMSHDEACSAAAVLAVAGGVRTYCATGGHGLVFVDAPPLGHRLVDLAALERAPAAPAVAPGLGR